MTTLSTEFHDGDRVVYPAHGLGTIKMIDTQTVAGIELAVYVIVFERQKMTLRIPTTRAASSGLRHLSSLEDLGTMLEVLRSRPKLGKGMWSRRAQEYEAKINSGSLLLAAEVVRDLYRNVNDPDRSYSERVIYESALYRVADEVAAIRDFAVEAALEEIIDVVRERQAA